jgi:ubiquinone/menaquinone biosynthesis C-methylase UbiE
MVSSRSVRIAKARTLLQPGIPGPGGVWADLGCGDGIFTAALYTLIRPGGEIYAVDKNRRALQSLQREFAAHYPEATLYPLVADFTAPMELPPLDGLVMANALHFVRRKTLLLSGLSRQLTPGGRLIVVEYNTAQGNYAVPHPVDEVGFLELVDAAGLHGARVISRIPSSFLGEMYAGLAFTATNPT